MNEDVIPHSDNVTVLLDSFRTERLRADRLNRRDFALLCRMHRDPEVMKTLGGLRSDDKTLEYLRQNLDHWDRYGFGLWMLRHIESGEFIGRSAIRHVNVGGNDEVEIAYALTPEYWGRGLATEVSLKMLQLASERLQLKELVAFALPENTASHRVIEKAGGVFESNVPHDGYLHALYRFRCTAVRCAPINAT